MTLSGRILKRNFADQFLNPGVFRGAVLAIMFVNCVTCQCEVNILAVGLCVTGGLFKAKSV
jgi:hypothetical protein